MTIELFDVMNLYAFEFCSYPMKVMRSDFGDNLSVRFSCGIKTQASHPKMPRYAMSGFLPVRFSKGVFPLVRLRGVQL